MKPGLGTAFKPSFEGWATHLTEEDQALWMKSKHIITRGALNVYFDVKLGKGPRHLWPKETPVPREWLEITRKRADVIVEFPDSWEIIELRHNPKASALGRLILYLRLWKEDPPDDRPATATMVSDTLDPEVKGLADALNIRYLVF